VATIALTKDNKVIVSRQYRPAQERILYELPGGGAEKGEDFEQAACRELLEETGYEAGKMHYLGDVVKDAYNNSTWHYFWPPTVRHTKTAKSLMKPSIFKLP
jgi:ADP-ribose pyrophosphatase